MRERCAGRRLHLLEKCCPSRDSKLVSWRISEAADPLISASRFGWHCTKTGWGHWTLSTCLISDGNIHMICQYVKPCVLFIGRNYYIDKKNVETDIHTHCVFVYGDFLNYFCWIWMNIVIMRRFYVFREIIMATPGFLFKNWSGFHSAVVVFSFSTVATSCFHVSIIIIPHFSDRQRAKIVLRALCL